MKKLLLFFVLIAFIGVGCAYVPVSAERLKSEGVASISISTFENITRRPGIEGEFTSTLKKEFVNIIDVKDAAPDAAFDGIITVYELNPTAFTSNDVVSEYELKVTVNARLTRLNDKKVIWSAVLSEDERFAVNIMDVAATKDAEAAAFSSITADLARLIREKMLLGI